MNVLNPALLINLLGFTVGLALYALLTAMVLRERRISAPPRQTNSLLLAAALGVIWNAGELFTIIWRDFAAAEISPWLTAATFAALGFLPSVIVQTALGKRARWLVVAAYALSLTAAFAHFYSAFFFAAAPSSFALQLLTYGAIGLLAALLAVNFRSPIKKKNLWINALLIFSVFALHLSGGSENNSWLVELVAHQTSLPLVIVILLQDYRFAFADLFFKRALSLFLLAVTAFGLYTLVAEPMFLLHRNHSPGDATEIVGLLTLWMATSLVYPRLHDFAGWLVDKIILNRADFKKFEKELAEKIEDTDNQIDVLEFICSRLGEVLTARTSRWRETDKPIGEFAADAASVLIATAEPPFYVIELQNLAGGRRLLSEENQMLEAVALTTARRIDTIRVSGERHEREIRERDLARLASEAKLTALRAQINPHFLFNALTTIGYLIQTAPDRAFSTLMRLTQLLRVVLRTNREFYTLNEELSFVENYLDIEKSRFEEKLDARINVAPDLRKLIVPSFILQPLVENAVKHGISLMKNGGEINISARLENAEGGNIFLILEVIDSGAKFNAASGDGVGLENIRQRLLSYYGKSARLSIETLAGRETRAQIKIPVNGKSRKL